MSKFAHYYSDTKDALMGFALKESAASTIVCHRADGSIETVDSDELPAIADLDNAISHATFAVKDEDDFCELYRYGEFYGQAEYVDLTPESWFSRMEVVFSTYYG